MKILLITHYYPEHQGGVEIAANQLAKYLTHEQGVEIEWMSSDVNPHPVNVAGLHSFPMSASNFIENRLNIPYPLWDGSSLYKLWQAIKRADVVHLHDYLYMSNLAAFVFAQMRQKPVILTQHIGFVPYKNPLLRMLLSFLNQTLGSLVLKQVDRIVFISEIVQKYFSKKTCFRQPPLMIPNGVDSSVFFPIEEQQRGQIREALGLPTEKPLFLFVGRFVEKKGLHILRQLASRSKSIHWVFAGWGSLDPDMWKLPNVTVFRDHRGVQLTPLYQAADLLVLPSKGEGFPLVVQEAMACGTPVIVGTETAQAYSAATPLMFSADVEGRDTVEQWLVKIEKLLQNRSALSQLRPEVANFARQHWCWRKCAEQYYQIFQELANDRK